MSRNLYGAVVTPHGIAANNRGENEGNLMTLQKILWSGVVHTTVSAEAIRWAIRYRWQRGGLPTNRSWLDSANSNDWRDREFKDGGRTFFDDDILGYMEPPAARQDGAEGNVRRSRLEVTRAISLTPWSGDVVFNAASVNATPATRRGQEKTPAPYSAEVHATQYQYGFALTPLALHDPARALAVIDAIVDLGDVAGNHARYLFDFSPDAIIFRWTDDFAPRMLYPFVMGPGDVLSVPELLRRIEAGDIDARELVIGGSLADTPDGMHLDKLGASVYPGVKRAAAEMKERISNMVER